VVSSDQNSGIIVVIKKVVVVIVVDPRRVDDFHSCSQRFSQLKAKRLPTIDPSSQAVAVASTLVAPVWLLLLRIKTVIQ
jgi:hypothetical protein